MRKAVGADERGIRNKPRKRYFRHVQFGRPVKPEAPPVIPDASAQWRVELAETRNEIQALRESLGQGRWEIDLLRRRITAMESSFAWSLLQRTSEVIRRALRWVAKPTYQFELQPLHQLEPLDGSGLRWRSTGEDPHFLLIPKEHRFPVGWVLLQFRMKLDSLDYVAQLYWDTGKGMAETDSIEVPVTAKGTVNHLVYLPPGIQVLRWDPMRSPGTMEFDTVEMIEVTRLEQIWRMTNRVMSSRRGKTKSQGRSLGVFGSLAKLEKAYYDMSRQRAHHSPSASQYAQWVANFGTLSDDDRLAIRNHVGLLAYQPLISVVMPVYNTPEVFLRKAIDSVVKQLYPHWELCIADDASPKRHVQKVLGEYAAKDSRIKIVRRSANGHISAASNSALAIAKGEFVALMDHDDELAEQALYRVVVEINATPDVDLVYSDEDKISEEGERFSPHFKSDWNPDLFFSQNYVSHLGVYRTSLLRAIGGFREGFEGSQDYDLALRCVARTDGSRIRHIPEVLYHWRAIEGSTALDASEKNYTVRAGLKAVKEYFQRENASISVETGTVPNTYRVKWPIPDPCPKVSMIIPTRDGYSLLKVCVDSILQKTTYPNYEIIIVDNQSADAETLRYFDSLKQQPNIRVISYDHPFNYSAINNFAIRHASGDVIGLINNDIEVITPDWLEEMVSHAIRPDVGAVGAKLYYGDGSLQHGGIILGIGGVANHSHYRCSGDTPGYFARLRVVQNLSAVTGACLFARKQVIEDVGGLDETYLAVAFNDVDLCLRLRAVGYRIVWTPHAQLYHHESVSRGSDDTPEKKARFEQEVACMQQRWGDILCGDPYYNPNLTIHGVDFSLAGSPRVAAPWRRLE